MDYCKKCHAPIIWLKTPKGHWMCVDEGLKRYRVNKHGKDRIVTDRGETIACDDEFCGGDCDLCSHRPEEREDSFLNEEKTILPENAQQRKQIPQPENENRV